MKTKQKDMHIVKTYVTTQQTISSFHGYLRGQISKGLSLVLASRAYDYYKGILDLSTVSKSEIVIFEGIIKGWELTQPNRARPVGAAAIPPTPAPVQPIADVAPAPEEPEESLKRLKSYRHVPYTY